MSNSNRFTRIVAMIDFTLGIAFLIFVALGLLFHLAGFEPSAVVFGALGLVLIIVFFLSRSRGYRGGIPIVTSYATHPKRHYRYARAITISPLEVSSTRST